MPEEHKSVHVCFPNLQQQFEELHQRLRDLSHFQYGLGLYNSNQGFSSSPHLCSGALKPSSDTIFCLTKLLTINTVQETHEISHTYKASRLYNEARQCTCPPTHFLTPLHTFFFIPIRMHDGSPSLICMHDLDYRIAAYPVVSFS